MPGSNLPIRSATPTGDRLPDGRRNFANAAQRSVGAHIDAAEYLHLEGVSHRALQFAAGQAFERGTATADTLADIDRDGAPVAATADDLAEFERLVDAAEGPYQDTAAWGQEGDPIPPAVFALAQWFKDHGGRPSYHVPRLAAHLGWAAPAV